jgi:molybdopterin-guanine dinucleotide biosynthesis protein A
MDYVRNTTFVVLAGGEGSRMGKPKGLLTIAGRPILQHILKGAQWGGPTLLVTSPGRQSPPGADGFDAEVTDPVAGLGPMRGILTALEHAKTEQIVVSPVDMPSIGGEPFHWLANALFERVGVMGLLIERAVCRELILEPLPAAFREGARNMLQQRIEGGKFSLHRLVECDLVQTIRAPESWPEAVWNNLNFPKDLVEFEQDARG